jgi:long-chain acyl-CoA synthetase
VLIPKWEPVEAMRHIEKERLNGFGGVPAVAWQVIEHPDRAKFDLSSVDTVSYGGAPAAAELPRRIREAFPKVMPGNGYGLTETSAVTSQCTAEEYIAHPESCGIAVPVCDVKVCDPQGRELARGETGELWIKGPNVVKGYWGKPEDTAKSFREGWLVTGDIAKIDADGYISILDRAKDMLIRGGENIYCVEVENVLYRHPAVMDAAVVGLPHKVLGEEVGAVVQVKPGMSVTEHELQDHVAAHLARFKVPVAVMLRTEPLPRNPNGKILKRQLREEFAARGTSAA